MDILFLAHRVPFPPDRGDKIRSFYMLRYLSQRARVHLIAFADDERDQGYADDLAPLAASVTLIRRAKSQARAAAEALVSQRPISLTAFHDRQLATAVRAVLAREAIDAILVFSGQMAQYVPVDAAPRMVMDFVDMDSAKFGAYAANAHGPVRWLMAREEKRLFAFEAEVAARADVSLFVSEAEARLFRERAGVGRVMAVENGIDTTFFDPELDLPRVGTGAKNEQGHLLVFTGQMDYRPNVEGALWFAEAVWPELHHRHPALRFAIVGRNPTAELRHLERRPGLIVTGEVPDVRPWLAAAAIAVAPLRIARGVQNKVLEAMAMARPVVATDAAAEGIDHGGAIATAHDAASFAKSVDRLLADPERARRLGAAARARVIARYGWEARLSPLDALVGLPGTTTRTAA